MAVIIDFLLFNFVFLAESDNWQLTQVDEKATEVHFLPIRCEEYVLFVVNFCP